MLKGFFPVYKQQKALQRIYRKSKPGFFVLFLKEAISSESFVLTVG